MKKKVLTVLLTGAMVASMPPKTRQRRIVIRRFTLFGIIIVVSDIVLDMQTASLADIGYLPGQRQGHRAAVEHLIGLNIGNLRALTGHKRRSKSQRCLLYTSRCV